MNSRSLSLTLGVALAASFLATTSQAEPVSVSNSFVMLDHVSANSEGILAGTNIFYGAVDVEPDGSQGTTAAAYFLNSNGDFVQLPRSPLWQGSEAFPHMFSRETSDAANLRTTWKLAFSNGPDTTTRTKTLSPDATQLPFVTSLSIKFPTSLNPEISWSPPPGTVVNGYRINIYDGSPGHVDANGHPTQIFSQNLLNTQTSFTLPNTGNHQAGDIDIVPGANYIFEVEALRTINNGSTLNDLSNNNLLAKSRYFSVYTQPSAGAPTQVYLPVVLQNGSYQFNVAVQPDQTYYIDPTVATGYVYKTNPGDPNFASVILPDLQGSTPYHLSYLGTSVDLLGGVVYDFTNFLPGGVSEFTVTGIDPSLMLDPTNTSAFITGLTFTAAGFFTGTQTPISSDVAAVPVPPTLPLFAAGLVGLGLLVRRRTKKVPS